MIASNLLRAAFIGSLLAVGSAASAQTPASPPAAPQPGAVVAPTPGQLAAAREVVVASGVSRSFSAAIPQFMDQIGTALTQTRPELIRDLNTVLTQLQPEFDKQSDQMIGLAAGIYASKMSEKELTDLATFFKSPAGRTYVATQPAILNDLVASMQGWSQRISTDMMTRVRTEMRKKGHEL